MYYMPTLSIDKKQLLHDVAKNYVLKGLGEKNFDAIPYAENVELRAPLNPGGSAVPLKGKENLRSQWWAPLPGLLAGTDFIDTFVNADATAVTVEFHCHISNPKCTLRVIDRFKINDEGLITSQENFFDPKVLVG
jgi:hypothetical protein